MGWYIAITVAGALALYAVRCANKAPLELEQDPPAPWPRPAYTYDPDAGDYIVTAHGVTFPLELFKSDADLDGFLQTIEEIDRAGIEVMW